MEEILNEDEIISIIDDDENDMDDEIDLVRLVSTNANEANQYLLFMGSDDQYYAKNVSKIEELLVYRDLDIVHNNDEDSYILGTANIRGQMTSIVNFDNWIGNEVLDEALYELVIIAAYGGKRFALVVKEVEYITTIESANMSDNSADNSKSSFISQININGKEQLCTIFDSDMLIMDIFPTIESKGYSDTITYKAQKQSDEIILFADDSKFIRKMVEKLFIQLKFKFIIYDDGKELIEALPNLNVDDIGLIITDLEMPGASGREVIEFVRKNNIYDDINIIVHTNMANDIMEKELISMNVSEILGKVDMLALGSAIEKYIK